MSDLIKISMMAEEMELSYKTLYNWVASGDLPMEQAGYVSRRAAYRAQETIENRKRLLRLEAHQGTKRDAKGRWISG